MTTQAHEPGMTSWLDLMTTDLGGARACPVNEIEGVGKVAILRDPQGATFALLEPHMD